MIEYTVKVHLNDTKKWWLNGELHREDGPAVEWANGSKFWYLRGQRHREDGPAVEWANGDKAWYLNDELHREDGPAIEYSYGFKAWWLNGKKVTKEEHNRLTSKVVEMTVEEISKALGKKVKVVE